MKFHIALATLIVCCAASHAQNGQLVGATSRAQGGVLPLPKGVEKLAAVDAQNSILAQLRAAPDEPLEYRLIQVKHVYVGGIVALFGGTVIPTGPFVSPGFAGMNNFGAMNQGGFSAPGGFNQNQQNQQNNGFNGAGNGNQNQQNNGFNFPQPFANPFQNGFTTGNGTTFNPNRNAPLNPGNQPGIGFGTPRGNLFIPAQTTIR